MLLAVINLFINGIDELFEMFYYLDYIFRWIYIAVKGMISLFFLFLLDSPK